MERSILDGYDPRGFYCEMLRSPASAAVRERLSGLSIDALKERAAAANAELYNLGITFTVYSDAKTIDRILPFDVLPRVLSAAEWRHLESGIVQRITAINLLLDDIYHDQQILRDGIVPADLILGNHNYRPLMRGVDLPHKAYVNICGTDIVRDEKGAFLVLEDNARTPSGVSYVVENRHHDAARLSRSARRDRPAPDRQLRRQADRRIAGGGAAPGRSADPQVVLLSPGTYNSAYFEHVFLAREMGVPLVEGPDLVVEDERVWMRTTGGLARVDVIYRRINDDYLDPEAFTPDSMLGVRGLMRAYRAGNVALANAIGTGVADDKAVYAYMPRDHPLLSSARSRSCTMSRPISAASRRRCATPSTIWPSWWSSRSAKPAATASPSAPRRAAPSSTNAAPSFSPTRPTTSASPASTCRWRRPWSTARIEPRHVDLRPFAVTGSSTWVLPGGLTRVALRRGSLVVNSSQGGGSKDTWVLG